MNHDPTLGTEGLKAYKRGCRCFQCRAAYARYQTDWRNAHKNGTPPKVDAAVARAKLEALTARGYTQNHIAKASGLAQSVIAAVLAARTSTILRRTHEAIMAIDAMPLPDVGLVPAAPVLRIVAELEGFGYTKQWLRAEIGHLPEPHRPHVSAKTARRVAELREFIGDGAKPPTRRTA